MTEVGPFPGCSYLCNHDKAKFSDSKKISMHRKICHISCISYQRTLLAMVSLYEISSKGKYLRVRFLKVHIGDINCTKTKLIRVFSKNMCFPTRIVCLNALWHRNSWSYIDKDPIRYRQKNLYVLMSTYLKFWTKNIYFRGNLHSLPFSDSKKLAKKPNSRPFPEKFPDLPFSTDHPMT